MISPLSESTLKGKKNLLAFSAGVDSTALFFLLLEKNINFDIAIVDYNLRAQSKEELSYANELSLKYSKSIYHKSVTLEISALEKNAREQRYAFFEEIIEKNSYNNLLTAHQLNDRLEWFLMQLSRGSGIVEMVAMSEIEKRDKYTLIRPLLFTSKDELKGYLTKNSLKFFLDESNEDTKFTRNYFRHNFATELIKNSSKSIKKSFSYLEEDINDLIEKVSISSTLNLYKFKTPKTLRSLRFHVDKILKENYILLSSAQRDEINFDVEIVLSGKFVIAVTENLTWIAPYIKVKMDKKFKEKCRITKIPKKIRPYLFANNL